MRAERSIIICGNVIRYTSMIIYSSVITFMLAFTLDDLDSVGFQKKFLLNFLPAENGQNGSEY